MRTVYMDCSFGIAGDMTIAALIDLGADIQYIERHLRALPIDSFKLETSKVIKQGMSGLHLKIQLYDHEHGHHHGHENNSHHHDHSHEHDHHSRKAKDILEMIHHSHLPDRVKERSGKVFTEIAHAEAKIHGISADEVHFHEVGAMDSIIDIIGVCLALESLDIDQILASPVALGHGTIHIAHGLYPVPAPATAELLKGFRISDVRAKGELTTPTGAGILRALTVQRNDLPAASIQEIGYGAGTKDFEHPNILRVYLLDDVPQLPAETMTVEEEEIIVLETQIDDMTGEALGYVMESLFKAGALDVYFTPIYMKKNRPGTLISVLTSSDLADVCEEVLFMQTSTFGVRRSIWKRHILKRHIKVIETSFGPIRIKEGLIGGKVIKQAPEFEDISKAARERSVPFADVYESVMRELKK